MRALQWMSILAVLGVAAQAEGRTWTVQKDGSGDFTVIQDAVDAAASRDSIQIGPGRFDDVHTFQGPGGAFADMHVLILQEELTIIGTGPDVTYIGPASGPGGDQVPRGIVAGGRLRVQSLTIENTSDGIEASGPTIFLEDCILRRNYMGLDSVAPEGTTARNCQFEENQSRGIIVFQGLGATNVLIEDCDFSGNRVGVDLQSDDGLVRNCTFEDGIVGLQLTFGGEAVLDHCDFRNMRNWGIGLTGGAQGTLSNCTVEGGVAVTNGSHLAGTGNILVGDDFVTLDIIPLTSTLDFHGNHILNGGGYSVRVQGEGEGVPVTIDLTNNYWGTTDPEQIAAWILDGEDDPLKFGFVEFTPFWGMPIAVEETTFGGLKSRY